PPLLDGLQPAELEARQADPAGRAHDLEAEVGEEVLGKYRPVDSEALVARLALRVAVRERFETAGASIARLADRREEERLQHPRARRLGEVRARDEDGTVRRRPARQLGCARERLRRAVLHRTEHATVPVVVDGAPGAEVELDLFHPAALVGRPPSARLPPDALVTYGRRGLERQLRQACKTWRHHLDRRTSSVASGRAKNRNGTKVVPSPGDTCIAVGPRRYTPWR